MARLDNVASGVDHMSRNFSTDSITEILAPFTDFLQENNPHLTAIFTNIQAVTTRFVEGQGTLGKLMADDEFYNNALDTVTNFDQITGDIQSGIDLAKSVVKDIKEGRGTLGKLTTDEALYRESTGAMANLREVLEKVNQGKGSVGVLVNDRSFLDNAKLTLKKVDKATEGLEDQGPLSVIGLAVGTLF